jgi:hypothetical protein
MPHARNDWQSALASLPVGQFLSDATWGALQQYVSSGSSQLRGYRLLEFFRALDWLPMDEIEPNPLKQFGKKEAQRIHKEIGGYLQAKQTRRKAQRVYRENYRLKVFEYYRSQISPEDKERLEQLRDYELERIGQDVNWRHYYWFTSMKQIDAFVNQTAEARQLTMEQFKRDVEAHYRNAQRLREGTYADYYWGGFENAGETFDEWANRQTQQFHRKTNQGNGRRFDEAYYLRPELREAYLHLKVAPGASLKEVRQQFRQLAMCYHPDRPGGSSEKMKQILTAYDVIKKVMDQRHTCED